MDVAQQNEFLARLKAQLTAFLRSVERQDWAGTRRAFGFLLKPLRQCIGVGALCNQLFDEPPSDIGDFLAGVPELHYHVAFWLLAGESLDHPSVAGMVSALSHDHAAQVRVAPEQWAQRISESPPRKEAALRVGHRSI